MTLCLGSENQRHITATAAYLTRACEFMHISESNNSRTTHLIPTIRHRTINVHPPLYSVCNVLENDPRVRKVTLMKALKKRATQAEMISYLKRQNTQLGVSQLDTVHRYIVMGAVLNRLKEKTGLSSYDRSSYLNRKRKRTGLTGSRTEKSPWGKFLRKECGIGYAMAHRAIRMVKKWPTIEKLPKRIKSLEDAADALSLSSSHANARAVSSDRKRWRETIPGLMKSDGPMSMLVAIANADPDRLKRVLAYIARNHKAIL